MLGKNERPRLGTEGAVTNHMQIHDTTPAGPAPASIKAVSKLHRKAADRPAAPRLTLANAIDPLLSIAELAAILNVSRRAVERMRSSGRFPRPDLMIGKMPRWKAATVRSWIDASGKGGAI
jgi:predicted DNA-binding transcriptional regulator AlpA